MRKFLHDNFEIDLSSVRISTQDENHWFSDRFFTKYTLPFELPLDEENDKNFGFLSIYNSEQAETLYKGYYFENDSHFEAVLEIEEAGENLQCSIRFGFEEFPSFTKKLSELNSLDKFEVENIYLHAGTVVQQSWPHVNYNFPQIHTDKIDTEDDIWFAFEKIINNRKDGLFLENEVDTDEDITYNRNIMQPLPYLLHILQAGFLDAGKTLTGDLINDPIFRKILVYADVIYYTTFEQESINVFLMSEDHISQTEIGPTYGSGYRPGYTLNNYHLVQAISYPGKYRITGSIKIRVSQYATSTFRIKYRGYVIFEQNIYGYLIGTRWKDVNVDVVFETMADLLPNEVVIESSQISSTNNIIAQLDINPIRLHDISGEAIPTVLNPNQINLQKAVPEMTFGDFFTALRNWFNLGIDIHDDEVNVYFIEKEISRKPVIDLSQFEVKKPRRKFNKGVSFLLEFQEIDSEEYKFPKIFHSAEGVVTSGYTKNEKTNEITINGLPLPMMLRSGVQTAHGFLQDNSRLQLLIYPGLTDDMNVAENSSSLQLTAVHEIHHKDWFDSRINSQDFEWDFLATPEEVRGLKSKGLIFAYNNRMIVKIIGKESLSEDITQYTVEAATSKNAIQ